MFCVCPGNLTGPGCESPGILGVKARIARLQASEYKLPSGDGGAPSSAARQPLTHPAFAWQVCLRPLARFTCFPRLPCGRYATGRPWALRSAATLATWSPCTSTTPSLTVPPEPQLARSSLANNASAAASSARPRTRVTLFPLRPLLSRLTRALPLAGTVARTAWHWHLATGWRHAGHMRPLSVE